MPDFTYRDGCPACDCARRWTVETCSDITAHRNGWPQFCPVHLMTYYMRLGDERRAVGDRLAQIFPKVPQR